MFILSRLGREVKGLSPLLLHVFVQKSAPVVEMLSRETGKQTERGGKRHELEQVRAPRRMTAEEQAVKLAELEQRAKSNTRRVEKLELSTGALHKLVTSVELLVAEQGHQTEAMLGIKNDVAKLDSKVETLEHKPGKRWESIVDKVTVAVAAALTGFFLARLGIG